MKKILINGFIAIAFAAIWMGCKRDSDYVNATPSPFIANFDLRKLYTGKDVTLTDDNMRGASTVRGLVISDHSGGNLPVGLLILQNSRTAGNGIDSLRGMSINIGADASKYVPGDSVHVKIEGGVLKRVDGIMQITGISGANVTKVASGRNVVAARGYGNLIAAFPDRYESTLVNIVKGTFNPTLAPNATLRGDLVLNDGAGDIILHTEATATFANVVPPYSGNYKGIVFTKPGADGKLTAQHRIRTAADLVTLSSTVDVPEVVFSGFINDVAGGDGNYEYMQFRATKDINFAVTPFSITTCNNAGTTVPQGVPLQGWATGQAKTYKLELKTGTVKKGEFFYVGGINRMINGSSSTSIASANWILALNYNTASPKFNTTSEAFGSPSGGLFANSGNAFGMAIFRGLEVTSLSQPIDVVWVHNGGSLFVAGPPPTYGSGYRVGNTDFYDAVDPATGIPQPYYNQGTNTQRFTYVTPVDIGSFYVLGGTFDTGLGKWVQARSQTIVRLTKTSSLAEIEGANATVIK
ncbi:MAG: DUF5689 domain-containing protein [Bacteroidia bacterium]